MKIAASFDKARPSGVLQRYSKLLGLCAALALAGPGGTGGGRLRCLGRRSARATGTAIAG